MSQPNGPAPEFGIRALFNPGHGKAWAVEMLGPAHSNWSSRNSLLSNTSDLMPETDVLPDILPSRGAKADETRSPSEFQTEVVQLAAILKGDHSLSSFRADLFERMRVKVAHRCVREAVKSFIRASKYAIRM